MDNVNNTCAPKMADGRLFSDYRHGLIRDNVVLAGFQNGNDHRHFMQQNADKIMAGHATRTSANECNSCDISKSPKAPIADNAKASPSLKVDTPAAVVGARESFSAKDLSNGMNGDNQIVMGVLVAVVGYGVYRMLKFRKMI